ncbi:hypothetical protein Z947_4081 [Sulfitobacter geojensis]|nr:hypothetical protein Z947_4081 [Sulfitobacter geojensis]
MAMRPCDHNRRAGQQDLHDIALTFAPARPNVRADHRP